MYYLKVGGELCVNYLYCHMYYLSYLFLGACSSGGFKADHKYEIEPFEFTNQNNEKVSLDDLKGQVWLSQFVFTNCTTVCGPMMFHMAELQDQLIKNGVEDYKLVSFSVDPKNDTPEVLQEYLNGFAIIRRHGKRLG